MLKANHTPSPFDHPEFIAYPNHPDLLQAYPISTRPESTTLIPDGKIVVEGIPFRLKRTSVFLKDQLWSATYVADPKGIETIVKYETRPESLTKGRIISVEVRENGFRVKTEAIYGEYLEETWYQDFGGERVPVAIRWTRDGMLSTFVGGGSAAVFIQVYSPTRAERREYWEKGVLKKVQVFQESSLQYEEKWEDGKSFVKTSPGNRAPESVMKLVNRKISPVQIPPPSSPVESTTPTPYSNKLIPAEHARKLVDSVESVDFYIEKLNRQIKEAAMRGYSYTQMMVPCYEARKALISLIQDAGYVVRDINDGDLTVDFA
jgi:hypothetical protein